MWPFAEEWGAEKEAIRDFLKKAWTWAANPGNAVETNVQTVGNEAKAILQVIVLVE